MFTSHTMQTHKLLTESWHINDELHLAEAGRQVAKLPVTSEVLGHLTLFW